MSPRPPRLTAADAIRAVKKAGFFLARQSGSHMIFKNAEGKRTTIPYHVGDILHPKTLQSIIRDSGMTVEEFLEKT